MSPLLLSLGAVVVPLLVIPFLSALRRVEARWFAGAASVISLVLSSSAAVAFLLDVRSAAMPFGTTLLHADALTVTVGPAIAATCVALILGVSSAELEGRFLRGVLALQAAGIGSLVAGGPLALVFFELLSAGALVFLVGGRRGGRATGMAMGLVTVLLVVAIGLDPDAALTSWAEASSMVSPGLVVPVLLAAVLLRLSVAPFGTWSAAASMGTNSTHALPALLPLGGVAIAARWLHPLLAHTSQDWVLRLPTLLLLMTAITAAMTLVQRDGMRALAFTLAAVQGLVLVAILDPEPLGHLGGELMWGSSLVAGAGFGMAVHGARSRLGSLDLGRFSGLDGTAPRLGSAVLIFGLALAGLPGSVEFIAQELLLNAGISRTLPGLLVGACVAALLGYQNLRLYFRVFHGPDPWGRPGDLLPREVVALGPLAALLLAGGVAPGLVPLMRVAQAAAGHAPL